MAFTPYNPNAVSRSFFPQDDYTFTYYVSGVVAPTDVGAAVTWDTTQPDTVKLCTPGDEIIGVLEDLAVRLQEGATTGSVMRKFTNRLTLSPGITGAAVPVVGSTVMGGITIPGTVQKNPTTNWSQNVVTQVQPTYVIVEKF